MAVTNENARVPEFNDKWLRGVAVSFTICCLLWASYLMTRHPRVYLTLEMSSSTPSTAQLFYNTGAGYNEAESDRAAVTSHSLESFQTLKFGLPPGRILSFRFDPLTTAGSYSIRNVAIRTRRGTLLEIPPASVVPFHQIQRRVQQGKSVTFETTADATDTGVLLSLQKPFSYKKIINLEKSGAFLIGAAILLCAAILAYRRRDWLEKLGVQAFLKLRKWDEIFGKIAEILSLPEFIRFDSYAIWFYALCLAGFILSGFADLNGSSIGVYNSVGEGAPASILLGAPRAIRSDEWVYYTPDILNQSLRPDRFAVEHTQRGDHDASLIDNIPVKHVSTLFRPQFWPFFVLPVDYAFAFYWQFKALVLLLGVFTWLLLVTRSTFWSITGSLWCFFSPITQWCYSWSSELPEMIGLGCFAAVLFCFLTVGKNTRALIIAAWAFATCAIDFALCAYVPHLLPLAWLIVFFVAMWCVISRKAIFQRQYFGPRVLMILAAFLVIGIIGATVYSDLAVAIHGIENTEYPGKRLYAGASLSFQYFTSHFMQWTDTETHFPPALGNICEGSGCLWLAPITLLLAGRLSLTKFQKAALAALWCFSLLVLAWLLLPVPMSVGKVFAMDRTGFSRCTPALMLANVTIVVLAMVAYDRMSPGSGLNRIKSISMIGRALGSFLIVSTILALTNQLIGSYYSIYTVGLSSAFLILLIILMWAKQKVWFALALIVPQAVVFGAVNPVERGLGVVLNSQLYHFVNSHPNLRHGKWVVFSDSIVRSGFLEATGCDVYTGMHFLPDLDHFSLLASKGLDVEVINNGVYLEAHPLYGDEKNSFQRMETAVARLYIHPLDPLLKKLGIRYLAFDQKPPESVASHLIPLSDQPLDSLWLYKLPSQ